MAVYGNFKGTTQPGFTVGRTGAATIHGNPSSAPASATAGDVWMDSANTALKIYDGSDWSEGTFVGNLEGNLEGFIELEVVAGERLSKGDVVYVAGHSGNTPQVSKALSNAHGAKMPAIGVAKQAINSGNTGYIVVQGLIKGINTSAFAEGDVLYVSPTVAGKVVNTAPTGEENKIQNVGKVINSAGSGSVLVTGAGRFNATSALDEGNIFLGNASNQSVTANLDLAVSDLGYQKNIEVLGGYVFTQSSNASVWTVNHNLDQKYVNVEVIDDSGNTLTGTSNYPVVEFVSNTQLIATFTTPTDGFLVASAGSGVQGDTGFNGSVGFTGSQGDQGIIGFTGSQGDQGITGFTGSKGDTGFNGSAGAENATLDSVTDNGSTTTNSITTGGVQTTTLTTGSNSTAGTVTGDWTLTAGSTWSATYADLAEKYTTDAEYEAGTVLKFGGDAELTQSDTSNDFKVAGVVSTNPAYILNAEIEGQYLALSGRVPVKVNGSVFPGDILVSSNVPGHAEVNNDARSGRIIGKAITADANGVCEALVTLM